MGNRYLLVHDAELVLPLVHRCRAGCVVHLRDMRRRGSEVLEHFALLVTGRLGAYLRASLPVSFSPRRFRQWLGRKRRKRAGYDIRSSASMSCYFGSNHRREGREEQRRGGKAME